MGAIDLRCLEQQTLESLIEQKRISDLPNEAIIETFQAILNALKQRSLGISSKKLTVEETLKVKYLLDDFGATFHNRLWLCLQEHAQITANDA